jgi:hypothetical protein
LDILSGMKGAHAKIVLHSSGLILEKWNFLSVISIFLQQFSVIFSGLKII